MTRPAPIALRPPPQEGRAGQALERGVALEDEVEVELREPRMLAGDLLGARAVTRADGVDEHPVLVLCDDQDLLLARQGRLRRDQGTRRGERQRDDVRDRPRERVALRERDERRVELVVQLDESLEGRRARGDDRVELLGDGDEAVELRRRPEPLGREARRGALEDSSELDRIGDVLQREGAHDEPAAGKRAEQPLVRQRREREPERGP